MSSLFDTKETGGQTSQQELAALTEAEPDLAAVTMPEAEAAEQPGETVAETQQPAPSAEESGQPADAKPGKTVPIAEVARLREEKRELATKFAELNGKFEQMQRMLQPQQPSPQAQPQEEQAPNRDEDPLGYMEWQTKRLERLEQQQQGQILTQRVQQDYAADAMRFAAQTPDFPAAYNHLFAGRAAELKAQGWQDDAIRGQIQREEFNIALGALRAGRSPAQQAYELAKARGYVATQPKPADKPAPTVDPVMADLKKKAAAGISEGGAAPKGEGMSWEDIGKLSGAAFDAAFEKKSRTEGRKSSLFRN